MFIPSQFNQYNRNKKIIFSSEEEYHCCYCGIKLIKDKSNRKNPDMITIDHKVARNDGGRNSMDNLATSCSRCNNLKGSNYSYDEFKSIVKTVEDRNYLYLKTTGEIKASKQKRKLEREHIAVYNLAILFLVSNLGESK